MNKDALYGYIHSIFSDVDFHLERAANFLGKNNLEKSIVRCERAINSLCDAEKEINKNIDDISHQKNAHFKNKITRCKQKIWQVTRQINESTKGNFYFHQRARGLRLNFLAHSHNPSMDAEDYCEAIEIS